MDISLCYICLRSLFTNATAAVLSTCIGVGSYGLSRNLRICLRGGASFEFSKMDAISVSAVECIIIFSALQRKR